MQFPKVMRLTLFSVFDDRPDVGEGPRKTSPTLMKGAASPLWQVALDKSVMGWEKKKDENGAFC